MRRAALVGIGVVLAIVLIAWKACGTGKHGTTASSGSGSSHGTTVVAHHVRDQGPVQPASMAGRVTRASDGAPVAGATVSLAPAELMAMFIKNDMPTLVATTDASGNWKVARVMPGQYVVAATASGYLPNKHAKVIVQQSEERTGIDIALTEGGTVVRGTVTDVGGGPIADARITANGGGEDEIPDLAGHADYVVATGADGKYEITLPDGSFSLEASHDDYTSKSHRVVVAGKPLVQDFQLIPGAVVRGQVVARDSGKPVPGALIRAEGGHGADGGTAIADADGNFTMRSLGSGTLELYALGRGYSTQTPTVVNVGIGEQADGVRILVDRAYSISGRVVRKGKPDQGIPGITLGAFSIAAKSFGLAIEPSAQDGYFEIYGCKPASYMLFAVGEGNVPDIGKNVEVVDKDVENVIVELSTGVTIAGRVDPPMAGAKVRVELAGAIGITNMFDAAKLMLVHGETDASGAFTLKNVPAGSLELHAAAPDGHSGKLPITVGDADKAGVVVKLEARASISGRVVDTNGAPVANGRVYVDKLDDSDVKVSFNGRGTSSFTNPDGTYKVVGLEPGKVRVRATDGGNDEIFFFGKKDEKAKNIAEVTVVAQQDTTNINLTVDARDGMIKGQVVGTDGKPAADAWVTAQRNTGMKMPGDDSPETRVFGGNAPPVLTDAGGNFTIPRLKKAQVYNLVVEGPRGLSHGEKPGVKVGETVTIPLAALGTITGKVTLGGAPVTSFDISCDGKGRDAEKHIDAADGAYTLERVNPGSYTCSVDAKAGTGSAKVEVPAGEVKLDIALTRYATITGTVVSVLDKKPVAGVSVLAGSSANPSGASFEQMLTGTAPKTDANGRFTVDKVPVGKGKVAVMPKDGFMPLGTHDYTLAEGQSLDVGTIEIVPPREGDAGTFGMSTGPTLTGGGSGSASGSSANEALVVLSVKDGGPAQAAGIQEGDRILTINGQDVAKLTPLIASQLLASGNVGVGQTVVLTLERGGAKVTATVTSVKW